MADIKLNANPEKKHTITFSIQDAPGAFSLAKAFATYDIVDKTCLPPADNFQGVQMAKSAFTLPLELVKGAGDSYVATVAEDAIADSDLYGQGICHWKLTSAHIRLSASGRSEDTSYVAALPSGNAAEARTLTLYYLKSSYPSLGNKSPPDHGIEDVALLNPAVPAAGWFTITVSSTELTP
ncbi:hypothetical protein ABU614_06635 [Lysobacter firmicutimachus]|uniref:Uncharacterized protein n=1 Tax=Lysobacter firmicutimachus TaxID=1792846 RepID=A0AAU8MXZ1_9GAMM